jgi:hypothetical protein
MNLGEVGVKHADPLLRSVTGMPPNRLSLRESSATFAERKATIGTNVHGLAFLMAHLREVNRSPDAVRGSC